MEWFLLQQNWAPALIEKMVGGRFSWLVVLGAFMGVSFLAGRLAASDASKGVQCAGLAIFVVAEAVIFLPLLDLALVQTLGQKDLPKRSSRNFPEQGVKEGAQRAA